MIDVKIILSVLWIAVMLVYLLGDVLRVYSGDFKPDVGEIAGVKITQKMWLGIAVLMVLPILMVVLSILLPQAINRWVNIIVSVFFLIFNLMGLPTYKSGYDKFLIIISLIFNIIIIYFAWTW